LGVQFTIGHLGGGSKDLDLPPESMSEALAELLRELHTADDEHYQVSVSTPAGLSLTVFDSGLMAQWASEIKEYVYYLPSTLEEAIKVMAAAVGAGSGGHLPGFTAERPDHGPGLNYILLSMGDFALHKAAGAGNSLRVKELLAAGHDVNRRDRFGVTPIMLAAINGRSEVCRLLIAAGADLSVRDNDGWGLLRMAKNSPEAAAVLRQAGATE
jgi:hypothetical protein